MIITAWLNQTSEFWVDYSPPHSGEWIRHTVYKTAKAASDAATRHKEVHKLDDVRVRRIKIDVTKR